MKRDDPKLTVYHSKDWAGPLGAFKEIIDFLDVLMTNTPSEATDLLDNHGEDVHERAKAGYRALRRKFPK